jgi:alpha-methylacyl-CoA racemase
VAVGAIAPQVYAKLLEGMGLDADALPHQMDRERWDEMRELFTKTFASKTRDEWSAIFDGTDACVAPILGLDEAASHPANVARNVFVEGVGGTPMPAPAPRLSRTPGFGSPPAPVPGAATAAILGDAGMRPARIEELRRAGAVG